MMRSLRRGFATASKKKGGSLYTWGGTSNALGYNSRTYKIEKKTRNLIRKVEGEWDGQVSDCFLGNKHSAFVTTDGKLYTFGANKSGVLGHGNDSKSVVIEPKLVQYFVDKGIKIKKVCLGQAHSIALTEEGEVYTWGMGKREMNFIVNWLYPSIGALGHPTQESTSRPKLVKDLKGKKIVDINAGHYFSMAIDSDGTLYAWGRGEYGVLGIGNNSQHKVPYVNTIFEELKAQEGIRVARVKSSKNSSIALMDNGDMYSWGVNDGGHLGHNQFVGVETIESTIFPSMINVVAVSPGSKIIDFSVSENCSIFLNGNGQVFWCGRTISETPVNAPLNLAKTKAIGVLASDKSYAVIFDDGNIAWRDNFFNFTVADAVHDDEVGFSYTANPLFPGKLLKFGGSYANKFLIVDESGLNLAEKKPEEDK